NITIEGETSLAFSEDVAARFMSYGWNVLHVQDANDLGSLEKEIKAAIDEADRPSLIIVDSHIAYGSPNKQDSAGAHGSPLGDDEIRATKENYGWDPDKTFYVPDEVAKFKDDMVVKGAKLEEEWNGKLKAYAEAHPDLAKQFDMMQNGELLDGWESVIPGFPADAKGLATRESSSK
ncbi:MAG: transketolase, partial [Gammaproteobacteria bacterium]|nr:transketolase [Gammaproteobacteria bacterium]